MEKAEPLTELADASSKQPDDPDRPEEAATLEDGCYESIRRTGRRRLWQSRSLLHRNG